MNYHLLSFEIADNVEELCKGTLWIANLMGLIEVTAVINCGCLSAAT